MHCGFEIAIFIKGSPHTLRLQCCSVRMDYFRFLQVLLIFTLSSLSFADIFANCKFLKKKNNFRRCIQKAQCYFTRNITARSASVAVEFNKCVWP